MLPHSTFLIDTSPGASLRIAAKYTDGDEAITITGAAGEANVQTVC